MKTNPKECDTAPGPYYVSVVRDAAKGAVDCRLLAGPFATHAEALAKVERCREVACDIDPRAHWYGFGTVRMAPDYDKPGALNAKVLG